MTARYGRVIFNEGPPVVPTVSVNSQSTIAVTTATESGVEAYSRVALQGVSLAGGAVRIASTSFGTSAGKYGPFQLDTPCGFKRSAASPCCRPGCRPATTARCIKSRI